MKSFWEANLTALGRRTDPASRSLVRALRSAGPGIDLNLRSRDQRILPGFVHQGQPRSLVSTFDADREATRWASPFEGGTVAVFGAAGPQAFRALGARGVRLVFWVEPRIEVWQSLLTWEDWSSEADSDEWVPVSGSPREWELVIPDRYHPLWDGAFRTVEWPGAVKGHEQLWDEYRAAGHRGLAAVAADASTQARFGERWYRNTLTNLQRLTATAVPGCPGVHVVVAGAGPGLDDALDSRQGQRWLADRVRTGDRLFSTDTALPALSERGWVPDLIFCLDGQLASYHHFVPARPPGVPVVADVAALPLLDRLGLPVVRYLSGHPFGAVVRRFFPELPVLDGSLGNVSGLAWRTALALGARSVEAWGVDFSYRDGQAYAHGTYVYPLAARKANRLSPLETRLGLSCYGAAGRERTRDARGRALDTTPLLRLYRQLWDQPTPQVLPVRLAHQGFEGRWETFAADWRHRLETLPLPPVEGVHTFVRRLPLDQRQDWLALWPLALALHRQGIPGAELPGAVRARALSFLPGP